MYETYGTPCIYIYAYMCVRLFIILILRSLSQSSYMEWWPTQYNFLREIIVHCALTSYVYVYVSYVTLSRFNIYIYIYIYI